MPETDLETLKLRAETAKLEAQTSYIRMKLRFRPILALTILSLLALALVIGLFP